MDIGGIMSETSFGTRLRRAVTSDGRRPFVLLANFEVEEVWARGETTLPRVGSAQGAALVNRMDEFAIWLGAATDTVLLKELPDPDYLAEIESQGFELPAMRAVGDQAPAANITQDVAADPALLALLRSSAASGSVLVSHSVSEIESSLATATGIPIAAPTAEVCKRVNGKVYSRKLADAHGIRQPRGVATETIDDWPAAVESAREHLRQGRTVVVKEAYGVSGKGLAVVVSEARLERVATLVAQRAERNEGRAQFSIEEWIDKEVDLNYQFTVGLDGSFHFDFVKVAATARGVHLGHSYPAGLSAAHVDEILFTAARIADVLSADGYFGVVGVDAIIDTEGVLYPMLEINARFNMSTYQAKIDQLVDDRSAHARAKKYDLRLGTELSYGSLAKGLGELVYASNRRGGIIVNNFATVNAAFATGPETTGPETDNTSSGTPGRLYAVVIGETEQAIDQIDAEVVRRLRTLEAAAA
jgi:hypothetical protein